MLSFENCSGTISVLGASIEVKIFFDLEVGISKKPVRLEAARNSKQKLVGISLRTLKILVQKFCSM